jgi:hypothetical protein
VLGDLRELPAGADLVAHDLGDDARDADLDDRAGTQRAPLEGAVGLEGAVLELRRECSHSTMWALRGNVAGVRAGSVAAGILFRHAPAAAAIRPGGSPAVSSLLTELRQLIESGPLAHLSTINADANPQVCVIWLGVDGDDLVAPTSSATLGWFSPLTRRGSPRCSWPTTR